MRRQVALASDGFSSVGGALCEPNQRAGKVEKAQVALGSFLIAGRHPTKPFQLVKEALDPIPQSIEGPVEWKRLTTRRVAGYHGQQALRLDSGNNSVGVVAGVGDAGTSLDEHQQLLRHGDVMLLPRRDVDVQ